MTTATNPVPLPAPTHAATEADVELLRGVPARYQRLAAELGKRIIGQDEIIRDLFVALAVQGHVLMIGVPGLAKTLLVRSLAEILELQFQRIQFTPDLMPSDITGTEIIEEAPEGKREFRFVPGPIFANLLLADEINRTPPKTQAALLEAMQERHVTVAGRTYALPSPFFVLATQNPIEQEGTYPLPEAQLDRFMFNLRVDYPSHAEEVRILLETTSDAAEPMEKVWSGEEMLALQHAVRQVPVPPSVAEYAVSLVQATRPNGPNAAGLRQALPAMGRGAARVAVPRARGQGVRRARRAFQRGQGGHPARGQARAAASAHRQLPRRGGPPDGRWDHRPTPGEPPVNTRRRRPRRRAVRAVRARRGRRWTFRTCRRGGSRRPLPTDRRSAGRRRRAVHGVDGRRVPAGAHDDAARRWTCGCWPTCPRSRSRRVIWSMAS